MLLCSYSYIVHIDRLSNTYCLLTDKLDDFHVVLWALKKNFTRVLDFTLLFDPTTDFHTYTVLINDDNIPDTIVSNRLVSYLFLNCDHRIRLFQNVFLLCFQ